MTPDPLGSLQMRPIHIFFDAENLTVNRLPPCELPANVELTVILGKSSHKAVWERRFSGSPATLRFVEMTMGGPNAMDFLLAFYIGEAVRESSGTLDVVIVSRDKGFDPLVHHLCRRQIPCRRVESLEFLPIVLRVRRMTLAERVSYAATALREYAGCPRQQERWLRMLDRAFQHCLPSRELAQVLGGLIAEGVIHCSSDGNTPAIP